MASSDSGSLMNKKGKGVFEPLKGYKRLSPAMEECFHRASHAEENIDVALTGGTPRAFLKEDDCRVNETTGMLETFAEWSSRNEENEHHWPMGYSIIVPVVKDEPYHLLFTSHKYCLNIPNFQDLPFTAVYTGPEHGRYFLGERREDIKNRWVHHFVLLPENPITKEDHARTLYELPWHPCNLSAAAEPATFANFTPMPHHEIGSHDYLLIVIINKLLDSASTPLDHKLELSNIACFMEEYQCGIAEIISDVKLAWGLCRALTCTDYFENSGQLNAVIETIVDNIREIYPEWTYMKYCHERMIDDHKN